MISVGFDTQWHAPDGSVDPSSPVGPGQIRFVASGLPPLSQVNWTIAKGVAQMTGQLTADANGNIAQSVALANVTISAQVARIGSAHWTGTDNAWTTSSDDVTITLSAPSVSKLAVG